MITPTGSSRSKRRRTSPQITTAASTRRKRVRGTADHPTHPATENNNDTSNNESSIHPEVASTKNPQPTSSTQTPTPTGSGLVESTSAILARYKAWRKAGAPHDLRCFECHQEGKTQGDLDPCETCPRVYHEACKPEDGYFVSSQQPRAQPGPVPPRQWYCPVCVHRGWHVTPPVLTPPQSPVLRPSTPASIPAAAVPAREENVRIENIEATSNTRESSKGQQIDTSREKEKSTDASRRKSRFDTLSPQVESALWVLYRELESVPLAQRRIADLENEMAQLRQEVRIRRNEIELTRASGSQVRVLREEVQKLKTDLASREAAVEETKGLKARNRELEVELERSRAEVEESARTLAEWKKKLSNLIGE
ncbi:uncharacterized protein KD926_007707 [Aspergillus affinis]|uniref:uncharacterized protein n=1 Tax=Aspergillus affinis TaxID=1070780 RepID=UPI0022FE7F78|nr:uncharacterized protein KD926_007707 [Aspergillus affinis]KAI9040764.1 hypothetical protein KD926_007707 [Aspergillus affinis]